MFVEICPVYQFNVVNIIILHLDFNFMSILLKVSLQSCIKSNAALNQMILVLLGSPGVRFVWEQAVICLVKSVLVINVSFHQTLVINFTFHPSVLDGI